MAKINGIENSTNLKCFSFISLNRTAMQNGTKITTTAYLVNIASKQNETPNKNDLYFENSKKDKNQ